MPPLEAMACGVPVIVSDNSSLPEVVGRTGKMVPSSDQNKLYEAMLDYLNDIENVSSKAIKAGPKRAQSFSWPVSAQAFLDAVREIDT